MGLIQAAVNAVTGQISDQYKEFFYCDSLSNDVLIAKGIKRNENGNNNGRDNIISNGSALVVNEGQCMIIVDNGEVVELCATAGPFIYDKSTEPSIFYGNLSENIKQTFLTMWNRVGFAGNTGKDQRIYYVNTKLIIDNLFGAPNPIPFRVVDTNIGLDIDTSIKVSGRYTFQVTDPLHLFKHISGNVPDTFKKDAILSQLKSDLVQAIYGTIGDISAMGIRYSELPRHSDEIVNVLNQTLESQWGETYGITLKKIDLNPIVLSEEDQAMIKELQKKATYSNARVAAGNLNMAQADALVGAATNEATGPMFAFAGMNMANMVGGNMNANAVPQGAGIGANLNPNSAVGAVVGGIAGNTAVNNGTPGWTCPSCGHSDNRGKFCNECGKPKPSDAGWTCECGTVNQGKFCGNCGKPKPAGAPIYKCDKCGFEPEDPAHPPKFCPNCGDPFDDNDRVQ
ncbi:MAG: SPFH domain-containing protein [Lachnospiraceae bacterium]|nr:SPFH domain-containing protein [Lachnospiraceae bacterium]